MRLSGRSRRKTNGTGFSNEASAKIRAGFYFRRPGFKSVPLPGLPWSPQFMEVYEAALSGQPLQIGASRTKLGTVSAAIVGYYYDQSFLALAPSTQRPLRGILERFRAEHGDKRIALLQ